MDHFDTDPSLLGESVDSFFKVKKNKKDKLKWLNSTLELLMDESNHRTSRQRDFLAAYRGFTTDRTVRSRDGDRSRKRRIKKFVVNHIHDITESKVSQMTRLKPDVEVLPTHAEYTDRAAAKVVSAVVKNIFQSNDLDDKVTELHRGARIFGENYMFILWDKMMGDNHPVYVQAKNAGLKKVTLEDGTEVALKEAIKTGDVKYELELPWRVLPQLKQKWNEVDYLYRIKLLPIDEVAEIYGVTKDSLSKDSGIYTYDMDQMDDRFLEDHIAVYEFYHRKTRFVGEDVKITFTKSMILNEEIRLSSDGNLPVVRLTDLDIPGKLHGVSKYEFALPVQKMYDNLSTLIAKNIYLTAHAKWVTPRGAVKLEQLGNDNTIVQYNGVQAPQLLQVQPNPPEVYSFRENTKNELQVLLGNGHGLSRGEIPKGITAATALNFLNELESHRASSDIAKHANLIKKIARMTIVRAADNYELNDNRLIRIVGKNNKFLIRHFDTAVLDKPYDVKFDSSSGFPETKASKLQRILETMQRNPTVFSPERWEELLDLGSTDRMVTLATAAIQAADSENEDIQEGIPVMDPESYEDHIAHWRSHAKMFQSRQFKEEADDLVIENASKHMWLTEELMIDKMKENPLFAAQVAQLKLFPLFPHDDYTPAPSAQHQEAMVQGQSNRGEPITGMIPGTDIEGESNGK